MVQRWCFPRRSKTRKEIQNSKKKDRMIGVYILLVSFAMLLSPKQQTIPKTNLWELFLGACAMTTTFLDNTICTFKILLSLRFPTKTSIFLTIFLSAPNPPPPSKAKILFFLVVSPSLNYSLSNSKRLLWPNNSGGRRLFKELRLERVALVGDYLFRLPMSNCCWSTVIEGVAWIYYWQRLFTIAQWFAIAPSLLWESSRGFTDRHDVIASRVPFASKL